MRYLVALLCSVVVAGFVSYCTHKAFGKNWDPEEARTEAGKIRSEYLSKAGTLPVYKDGHPTGETQKSNCCGEADAFEADDWFVDETGQLWAILTCNDPDNCKMLKEGETTTEGCPWDEEAGKNVCRAGTGGGKIYRKPGSKWKVHPQIVLLNYEPVNNTKHGWIYISPSSTGPDGQPASLCWAAPTGN